MEIARPGRRDLPRRAADARDVRLPSFDADVPLLSQPRRRSAPPGRFADLPAVTMQLPLFNEMYVAERLLDGDRRASTTRATSSRSRCSTTRPTRRRRSAAPRSRSSRPTGLDINYIHRTDRTGFKAGALENGLKTAKGEFVMVFDADFVPRAGHPRAHDPLLHRRQGRHGAGALGSPEPRLLAPHRAAGDDARRPLRHRAHRAQPLGPLLQLQRHRRHLAPRRRSPTRAAGSTTRSPRTWTSRTARSCAAGSSST